MAQKVEALHADVRELLSIVKTGAAGKTIALPADSEPLNVEQFAQEIDRSPDWVYDQIRLFKRTAGKSGVRVLPLGKPYQIPRSEVLRVKSVL